MDDRTAQFFISIATLCAGAALADLTVEITLADGGSVRGGPSSPRFRPGAGEIDDTGLERTLVVGEHIVEFNSIVACTMLAP